MIIIYEANLSVEEYARLGMNNNFPELDRCPRCHGVVKLLRHGFYRRYAIEEEKQYHIPICRLKCPSCRKTVSLLPDFLLPYFQNTLNTILKRLKVNLVNRTSIGSRQLVSFYRERFMDQLNQIEMFFREQGFRKPLPQEGKEKAIKLLEMILAFGQATFVRRSTGHFKNNFMAH